MALDEIAFETMDGKRTTLAEHAGKTVLVVNVASQCGLTPQYAGLQALYERYRDRGFEILGFPCNQFLGQEPGTHDEIKAFCESSFGVTFPLLAKIEVNGTGRHPLYEELTQVPDAEGHTGDIRWNFEKFVISPRGEVVGRFAPMVVPEAPELVQSIEEQLSQPASA